MYENVSRKNHTREQGSAGKSNMSEFQVMSSSVGNQAFMKFYENTVTGTYGPTEAVIQLLNADGTFNGAKGYDRPASTEVLLGADKENDADLPKGAYHHVISFNSLASFWEAMVTNVDNTGNISHIQRIMLQIVNLYDEQVKQKNPRVAGRSKPDGGPEMFYCPDGETEVSVNVLVEFVKGLSVDIFKKPNVRQKQYMDLIAEMYTWMPFNLVQGPSGRKADPGEAFDQAAAELTGNKETYQRLALLMEGYKEADANKQLEIFDIIETLFKGYVKDSINVRSEKDFLAKDEEVQIDLIERGKALVVDLEKIGTGTEGKEKNKKEQDIAKVERLIKALEKKDKLSITVQTLQSLLFEDLFSQIGGKIAIAPELEPAQQAIDKSTLGKFQVEYGSGRDNNCFFYALKRQGFVMTVQQMREQMNTLRKDEPDYTPNSMITEADMIAFATAQRIAINLFIIQGGVLVQAGVPGAVRDNGVYYILKYNDLYMPMLPVDRAERAV